MSFKIFQAFNVRFLRITGKYTYFWPLYFPFMIVPTIFSTIARRRLPWLPQQIVWILCRSPACKQCRAIVSDFCFFSKSPLGFLFFPTTKFMI